MPRKQFPSGIPLHQMPRGKEMRSTLLAPPGYYLVELDASNQEVRLAAEQSQDKTLIHLFENNMDVHSFLGSKIAGISYEEFIKGKNEKKDIIVGPNGYRACGKFVVLSSLYRVGAKKARIVARVQYGLNKDIQTIKNWQTIYHNTLPGIRRYWTSAVEKAKSTGYAETFGGRRYYITEWDNPSMTWACESNAINHPIQGSAGDMANLAIAVVSRKHPDFIYSFSLHDGLFFYVKITDDIESRIMNVKQTLDNLPYTEMWNWTPSIPFTWDAKYGKSWGTMKEI